MPNSNCKSTTDRAATNRPKKQVERDITRQKQILLDGRCEAARMMCYSTRYDSPVSHPLLWRISTHRRKCIVKHIAVEQGGLSAARQLPNDLCKSLWMSCWPNGTFDNDRRRMKCNAKPMRILCLHFKEIKSPSKHTHKNTHTLAWTYTRSPTHLHISDEDD